VKQISSFVFGLAVACGCAPASAQDLTAGKSPAQLFRTDCAECHRSPSAVASNGDVRMLADFLREHYTTKPETAGALAAYVSGFAASRGRRNRGDGEAAADGEDAGSKVRHSEDRAGRHRHTTTRSADGEQRAADEDAPRPPGAIRTGPASSKSKVRTRDSRSSQNEIGEAGKEGTPKVHKRRNRTKPAPPAPDVEPKD
jgi:hypothetical protein